jgi:hypothetical protein
MPSASAEWGWSWVILAHVVTWVVLIGYARYLSGRVARAREALDRETNLETGR